MAVNRLKYAQKLEQEIAKGKSSKEAEEIAIKYATIKKTIPKKKRKKIRTDYLASAKKTLQMLWHGSDYYDKVMRK